MHVLAKLHKNNGHTRILAQGDVVARGDFGVFQQFAQDVTGRRGFFALTGRIEGLHHVVRQVITTLL